MGAYLLALRLRRTPLTQVSELLLQRPTLFPLPGQRIRLLAHRPFGLSQLGYSLAHHYVKLLRCREPFAGGVVDAQQRILRSEPQAIEHAAGQEALVTWLPRPP